MFRRRPSPIALVVPAEAGTQRTQPTPKRMTSQRNTAERIPCVYILASKRNGTLYIGVTSDLVQRVWQHRNDFVEGFTKRYGVHTLVWYEVHPKMESAITREKQLKWWHRKWKLRLIEESNPGWEDLYEQIV